VRGGEDSGTLGESSRREPVMNVARRKVRKRAIVVVVVVTVEDDANDNTTSVTPPARHTAHVFAFTNVDLPSAYTPPLVEGGAWDSSTWA
jgi:hypothetical protein